MSQYATTDSSICTDCSSEIRNTSTNLVRFFSNRERQIYEVVNYVFISGVVALFGIATNIINIIVFYKQGFNSTVNISFFSLAVSDMLGLIFILWFGVCVNPLFINSDIDMMATEILYLGAGMPHICFARITGWITVFVTAERCLCIVIPLKIKQIVTPKRTTAIILAIYICITATFLPEYATAYHGWKFYESRNRTLLGLCFTSDHYKVDGLAYLLYSALGSASFVAVIILTFILVIQLNRTSKWRMKATGSEQTTKDKKAMTLVVMISTVLIVCYTPGVIVSMVSSIVTDFMMFGAYVNAFMVTWSFVFVMETVNSSINIFFYYTMSMKYRETFRMTLACWLHGSSDP